MKVFFPKKFKMVSASAPHPTNTEYKVSVGEEDWGGNYHTVIKVQMVYDGLLAGRRSPSYPIGSDDYKRVCNAIDELLKEI